jgi:hypothetical protein
MQKKRVVRRNYIGVLLPAGACTDRYRGWYTACSLRIIFNTKEEDAVNWGQTKGRWNQMKWAEGVEISCSGPLRVMHQQENRGF